MAAVQLLLASCMLAVLLPWNGGVPTHVGLPEALSVVALGVLGSGIAYVLFYAVIRAAGATTASTVTYVMPIVSTSLGVLVLREPLTWNLLVGGLVVLLGVWMNARYSRRA
jgi:drug/metabolite transporter (DMT)-like permease